MTNLIDLITPTNLETERTKFFADPHYHPVFHYAWQDQSLKVHFADPTKESLWSAILRQDHGQIVSSASQLFDVQIDHMVLNSASTAARAKGNICTGSSAEFSALLRAGLDYFGIKDMQVIESDEAGFNARPNHASRTITVSRHIHFEYFSMEGEVHHELVHVLRYLNGKASQLPLSPNYLPTEEGLASWCQDHAISDNGLAQHAMEYVASSVGISGSLRDIYDTLHDLGMSRDLAWKRSCRHKFGFVDTSISGEILKPAMYYANEIKVEKLSPDQKLRLFVGKIALSELPNYPAYTGLWPASQLAEYFKL